MSVRVPKLYSFLWYLQRRLERLPIGWQAAAPSLWLARLRGRLYPYDFVTGLYTRGAFIQRVEAALAAGRAGALLAVDVDNFAWVNLVHGHVKGDECLRHMGVLLREAAAGRLIGRLAGDEFFVYTEVASEVAEVAERIRSRFERDRMFDQLRPAVPRRPSANSPGHGYWGSLLTVSIGVAHASPRSSIEQLMRAAGEAQLSVKAAGRNGVAMREQVAHTNSGS
jgi:diguanylate cyclase (GGDEF)-like protein